jgi:hypothetical protein
VGGRLAVVAAGAISGGRAEAVAGAGAALPATLASHVGAAAVSVVAVTRGVFAAGGKASAERAIGARPRA